MYSLVRHPVYLGNFVIWLGVPALRHVVAGGAVRAHVLGLLRADHSRGRRVPARKFGETYLRGRNRRPQSFRAGRDGVPRAALFPTEHRAAGVLPAFWRSSAVSSPSRSTSTFSYSMSGARILIGAAFSPRGWPVRRRENRQVADQALEVNRHTPAVAAAAQSLDAQSLPRIHLEIVYADDPPWDPMAWGRTQAITERGTGSRN